MGDYRSFPQTHFNAVLMLQHGVLIMLPAG